MIRATVATGFFLGVLIYKPMGKPCVELVEFRAGTGIWGGEEVGFGGAMGFGIEGLVDFEGAMG